MNRVLRRSIRRVSQRRSRRATELIESIQKEHEELNDRSRERKRTKSGTTVQPILNKEKSQVVVFCAPNCPGHAVDIIHQ